MMRTQKADGTYTYREKIRDATGKIIYGPRFERMSDAKMWKRRMMTERDKGRALGIESNLLRKIKFKDYAMTFLKNRIENIRTKNTARNFLSTYRKHLFPIVGEIFLHEIRPHHADTIVQNLLQTGHREAGVNKIMQMFKSVMISAEREELILKNPLRHYSKLKVKPRPPKFWSTLEINQFLRVNKDDELYPLFAIALNTGMRRGELAGLCWDKIHFTQGVIEVSRTRDRDGLKDGTKNGRMRPVPINSVAKMILLKLFAERKGEFVFTMRDGSPIPVQHVYRLFERAQFKAGMIKKIRFHDLRHTYASHFVMAGGNLYDLQKILGHSRAEMTQIYAHLSQQHLISVADTVMFQAEEMTPQRGINLGAKLEPKAPLEEDQNVVMLG